MSNFDFDNDNNINVAELIAQFEQSVKNDHTPFFDQDDFEAIVEYYEEKGQFEQAMLAVEKSLQQYPYSSILLIKKAQVYFELKQLNLALEILEKAEIYDSSEIGIYLLRAEIFTFQSRYKDAIDILEKLLETSERDDLADIYLQMCDVYEDWILL